MSKLDEKDFKLKKCTVKIERLWTCQLHTAGDSLYPTPRPTPSPNSSIVSSVKRKLSFDCADARPKKKLKRQLKSEYEIEKIVSFWIDLDDVFWYKVKWKNWSSKYNTWEVLDNLLHCNYSLVKYFQKDKISTVDIDRLKSNIAKGAFKNVNKKNVGKIDSYDLLTSLKDDINYSHVVEYLKQDGDPDGVLKINEFQLQSLHDEYETDLNLVLRCILSMKRPDPGLYARALHYIVLMKIILLRKEFRIKFKTQSGILTYWDDNIEVENNVDFELETLEFNYTKQNILTSEIVYEKNAVGCKCVECSSKTKCCNERNRFAYRVPHGFLKLKPGEAIYECGDECACDEKCFNRTVQNGSRVKLIIFRTDNDCGWGVKAGEKIKRGTLVSEYVGEVITNAEAVLREVEYRKQNKKFLFDLDFNETQKPVYCIDATNYGNVSRFINHSCDPNVAVFSTFIGSKDENLFRLALFSIKDIKTGEEICFDYESSNEVGDDEAVVVTELEDKTVFNDDVLSSPKRKFTFTLSNCSPNSKFVIQCKCRSTKCRKVINFFNS